MTALDVFLQNLKQIKNTTHVSCKQNYEIKRTTILKAFQDLLKHYHLYEDLWEEILSKNFSLFTSQLLEEIIMLHYNSLSNHMKIKLIATALQSTFQDNVFYSALTFFLEDVIRVENTSFLIQAIQQSYVFSIDLFCFFDRIKKIDWLLEKGDISKCNVLETILLNKRKNNLYTIIYLLESSDKDTIINYFNNQHHFNLPQLLCETYTKISDTSSKAIIQNIFSYLNCAGIAFQQEMHHYDFFKKLSKQIFETQEQLFHFIKDHNISVDIVFDIKDRKNQTLLSYINNLNVLKQLLSNPVIHQKHKVNFLNSSYIIVGYQTEVYEISSLFYKKKDITKVIEYFDLVCFPTGFNFFLKDPFCKYIDKYENFYEEFFNLLKTKIENARKFFLENTKCIPCDIAQKIFEYNCFM